MDFSGYRTLQKLVLFWYEKAIFLYEGRTVIGSPHAGLQADHVSLCMYPCAVKGLSGSAAKGVLRKRAQIGAPVLKGTHNIYIKRVIEGSSFNIVIMYINNNDCLFGLSRITLYIIMIITTVIIMIITTFNMIITYT